MERGPGGRLHPIDHAGGDMSADGVKIVPFRRGEAVLLDPSEAAKFVTGQEIFFSAGPPRWYVRLWRWIKRGFRKPHRAWLKIALMALEGTLDHQAVIAAHIRRETGLEP